MTPTIRKEMKRGKATWIVDYSIMGKRKRRRCSSEKAAEQIRDDLLEQVKEGGEVWMDAGESERREMIQVFVEAKRMGLTMRDVWAGYLAGGRGKVEVSKPIGTVIQELVTAKRAAGRAAAYLHGLELYLKQFTAGRESAPIQTFTHADIEAWFASRKETPMTRQSNTGRLSGLFRFALKRGYITANPCDVLESITIIHKPPTIFTPDRAEKALRWAQGEGKPFLSWLVLGLCCGLRPEEADKTPATAIRLKDKLLIVDAAASKVQRRRVVHLSPWAVAWLKECERLKVPFTQPHITRRRWQRKLRLHLGLTSWPHDVLRHTFASYTMAEVQDAGKVAAEMGNSAGILLKHYRELMTKQDAAKYRKILP